MDEKISNEESLKTVKGGNAIKVGLEVEGGNSKKVETWMGMSSEAVTVFV